MPPLKFEILFDSLDTGMLIFEPNCEPDKNFKEELDFIIGMLLNKMDEPIDLTKFQIHISDDAISLSEEDYALSVQEVAEKYNSTHLEIYHI
jgi:hypothetical protein